MRGARGLKKEDGTILQIGNSIDTNDYLKWDGSRIVGDVPVGGSGGSYIQLDLNANAAADATFTNMPAAVTFFLSSYRHVHQVDLSGCTQARLVVVKMATAGAAASKLMLRYIAAFSTTASNYLDIGTSEISVAVNVQNTVLASGWINLAAGAKADVFIAVIGSGGDGALDPKFGNVSAQFK